MTSFVQSAPMSCLIQTYWKYVDSRSGLYGHCICTNNHHDNFHEGLGWPLLLPELHNKMACQRENVSPRSILFARNQFAANRCGTQGNNCQTVDRMQIQRIRMWTCMHMGVSNATRAKLSIQK